MSGEQIVELTSMRDYRRDAASIEVSRRLLSYLLSGAKAPGQKIPSERQLADILGVGRYVIREAFKTLTLLGLIDVRQGDGTYLRRPTSDLMMQSIQWGSCSVTNRLRTWSTPVTTSKPHWPRWPQSAGQRPTSRTYGHC